MAEARAEYKLTVTVEDGPNAADVYCECGFYVGRIVERPSGFRLFLEGASFPVYAVHGDCPDCGRAFHWTNNDEKLRRLVARRKALKEGG